MAEELTRPCLVVCGDYQGLGILLETYEDTVSLFQACIPDLAIVPFSSIRIFTSLSAFSYASPAPSRSPAGNRIALWSHPKAWEAALKLWDREVESGKEQAGNWTGNGLKVVWVEVAGQEEAADRNLGRIGRDDKARFDGRDEGRLGFDSLKAPISGSTEGFKLSRKGDSTQDLPISNTLSVTNREPLFLSSHDLHRYITDLSSDHDDLTPIAKTPGALPLPLLTSATRSLPSTPLREGCPEKRVSWVSINERIARRESPAQYSEDEMVTPMDVQAGIFVASPVPIENEGLSLHDDTGESPSPHSPGLHFPTFSSRSSNVLRKSKPQAKRTSSHDTKGDNTIIAKEAHNLLPFPRASSMTNIPTLSNSSVTDLNSLPQSILSAPATSHLLSPSQSRTNSFLSNSAPRPGMRRASTNANDDVLRRNSMLAPETDMLVDGYKAEGGRGVDKTRLRAVRESNGGTKIGYGGEAFTGISPEIKILIRPVDEWRSATSLILGRYEPIGQILSQYTKASERSGGNAAGYSFVWEGNKLDVDEVRTAHDLGVRESLIVDAYSTRVESRIDEV